MDQASSTAHADFLSSLSPTELGKLMSCARRISPMKREVVFAAGDSAESVFILVSGCIKLYQLSPNGKEIILWFSFPGELFGVAETVRGIQREIFAEANVDSQLLVLSQDDFIEFFRVHPEAAMRAIGILSARIRTLGSSFVDLAADDVETRLIRLLLRFAAGALPRPCDSPTSGKEICLNIGVTHNDLANMIGASRQTVTSTLAGFRRLGLVNLMDRHIHIVDPDGFRQLLERL